MELLSTKKHVKVLTYGKDIPSSRSSLHFFAFYHFHGPLRSITHRFNCRPFVGLLIHHIMARTTQANVSKRRKILKVQRTEESSEGATEGHHPNTDQGASSSKALMESTEQSPTDDIRRRLRSRKSLIQLKTGQNQSSVDAALESTCSRKRSSSKAASQARKTPRLSVATAPEIATSGPLTRSQKSFLNQVTPSPAAAKATTAATTFLFKSPRSKKTKLTSSLPEGVVDLYPTKKNFKGSCRCDRDDCSFQAITASYVRSYGKEYWQNMKKSEVPIITLPSPDCNASSSVFSPESSNSSLSVRATPEYKRDWVYLNTDVVKATQPAESAQYVAYQPDLTPKMRSILVDWIIELSEHFSFGPTTLHLAVTLVDKVLSCGPLSMDDTDDDDDSDSEDGESKTNCFLISRERFQLLGASCTWIACKLEELSPPNVEDFAYVSDNIYTTDQIKRMERRICKALSFKLLHHTPISVVILPSQGDTYGSPRRSLAALLWNSRYSIPTLVSNLCLPK